MPGEAPSGNYGRVNPSAVPAQEQAYVSPDVLREHIISGFVNNDGVRQESGSSGSDPDDKSSDKVVIGSLRGNSVNGAGLGKYVLALAAILMLLWTITKLYAPGADTPEVNVRPVPPVQEAVESNSNSNDSSIPDNEPAATDAPPPPSPKAPPENVSDQTLYDIAVSRGDRQVCDSIKDDYLRDHCIKYFMLNGA